MIRLRRALLAWFAENRRSLPWRNGRDPYRTWVSEVMLQQTQVATVVPYFQRFLKRFPNVPALAAAELGEVLKVWEGLGYYARARNLHRAADRVVRDFAGRIPDRWEEFRSLPGVGDYTAAAVLSLAFGLPFAVLDGNVKRVLARLFRIEAPANAPGVEFKKAADRLLDRHAPGTFNEALMELGALICTPRSPRCAGCPLAPFCRARRDGRPADYPRRRPKPAVPEVAVAVGIVRRAGRLLITQRRPQGLLGGLWEFPGGKVQGGETPEAACAREILEEVGLRIAVGPRLARIRHAYTHLRIVLDVFWCRPAAGRVRLKGPVAFRWVRPAELELFPFPGANRKFIPALLQQTARRKPFK